MCQHAEKTDIKIRPIEKEDTPTVAEIIRAVMIEFNAVGEGYSINDPEVDDMFNAYHSQGSAFYVVELNGQVAGCGGFAALSGGDRVTCELRKMYFRAELRGLGVGARLLRLCLEEARNAGFKHCYLETTLDMKQARDLYEKHGFTYLDGPMGNTGHGGCETWMARAL